MNFLIWSILSLFLNSMSTNQSESIVSCDRLLWRTYDWMGACMPRYSSLKHWRRTLGWKRLDQYSWRCSEAPYHYPNVVKVKKGIIKCFKLHFQSKKQSRSDPSISTRNTLTYRGSPKERSIWGFLTRNPSNSGRLTRRSVLFFSRWPTSKNQHERWLSLHPWRVEKQDPQTIRVCSLHPVYDPC